MTKLSKQISALAFLLSFVLPFLNLRAQGTPQNSVISKVQPVKHRGLLRSKARIEATSIGHSSVQSRIPHENRVKDTTSSTLGGAPFNTLSSESKKCGAYISEGLWKVFKCHNLGADEQVDPFTPSWRLNGDYYQWGRLVEAAKGPECDDGNLKSITIWNTKISSNGSWTDAYKTNNDPCPTGFRVPTKGQWEAVVNPLLNPTLQFLGTWSSYSSNYSSGVLIGSEFSGLFLPAAGARDLNDGTLFDQGYRGDYWSSTENGNYAWSLRFYKGSTLTYVNYRTFGFSVRCIEE